MVVAFRGSACQPPPGWVPYAAPQQAAMPPQQITIDSDSLARAMHGLMLAQPTSLPKALKDVADPGHVFSWSFGEGI